MNSRNTRTAHISYRHIINYDPAKIFGIGFIVMMMLIIILPALFIKSMRVSTSDNLIIMLKNEITNNLVSKENTQKKENFAVGSDVQIKLYDHNVKKIKTMSIEDYIRGVVSSEMPAEFNIEALKAQAVAARTYAVKHMHIFGGTGGCSDCPEADVCSRFDHCQAWGSDDDKKKEWGSSYNKLMAKVKEAVESTKGQVIIYQNQPIQAFFFSTSGGMTENAEDVFSQKLPYLKSVSSPGEEKAPHYRSEVIINRNVFADTFKKSYAAAKLTASQLQNEIKVNQVSAAGGVMSITVGGVTVKGTDIRKIFNLYSHDFTITYTNKEIVFHTSGYGHRVGMSQEGANVMAAKGSNYQDILKHYYVGTDIASMYQYLKK